jgi:hypothetical protein
MWRDSGLVGVKLFDDQIYRCRGDKLGILINPGHITELRNPIQMNKTDMR